MSIQHMINQTEFLEVFEEHDYPRYHGKWLDTDDFDPPFLRAELRTFAKMGLIEFQERQKRFRLTTVATEHFDRIRK